MCVHINIYMCIRMYSRTRAWTSRVNCRVPSLRMKTCVCDVTYIRMYMAIDMPLCLSAFSSHRFCLHLTLSLHPSSTFPLPLIWGFSRSLACSLCLFPLQTNNLIFAPCLSDRLLHRNCVLGCLNVFAWWCVLVLCFCCWSGLYFGRATYLQFIASVIACFHLSTDRIWQTGSTVYPMLHYEKVLPCYMPVTTLLLVGAVAEAWCDLHHPTWHLKFF